MKSENIIGSGAKRIRHGSYATAYRDNRGNCRFGYRGEIQTCDTRGITRLRKWFSTYEEAYNWAHANRHI